MWMQVREPMRLIRCLVSDRIFILKISHPLRSGIRAVIAAAVVIIGDGAALHREGMAVDRRREPVPASNRKSHRTLPVQQVRNKNKKKK